MNTPWNPDATDQDYLAAAKEEAMPTQTTHTPGPNAHWTVDRPCCDRCAAAPEMRQALRDALKIIGKVVADDLMPDIAAPGYPRLMMERIETLLAKIDTGE